MKRPSFQFYPADLVSNAKLKRCSWAARGAWVWVWQLMHDSDEYGVLRWPLSEIAQALGCPLPLLRELVEKGVMKGVESGPFAGYTWHPVKGQPVEGIAPGAGPIYFSSRMVRDEHTRNVRAAGGKLGGNPSLVVSPKVNLPPRTYDQPQDATEDRRKVNHAPTPSSSSSSSSSIGEVATPTGEGVPVDKSTPIPAGKKTNGNGEHRAQWWRSNDGILAKARESGVKPTPGETFDALKKRVFEAIGKTQRSGTQ